MRPTKRQRRVRIYFSDFFGIDPAVVEGYGAFDVSLINDLPLFIDPFLLFNSNKPEYQKLHDDIIEYVVFLRDRAVETVEPGLLKAWFTFPEVRQTWLGFSKVGNAGSGLGAKFAASLAKNLNMVVSDFGKESVTHGSHLEKLCLIENGVGRDNISDFTTNLIKRSLLEYTQTFAREHLKPGQRKTVAVAKSSFNYNTRTWRSEMFELPFSGGDYIILTPRDILTKDETWINRPDLFGQFDDIIASVSDGQLRAQLNHYFVTQLPRRRNREPSRQEISAAIAATIRRFPDVIDHYIRFKEDNGDEAATVSAEKVREIEELFIERLSLLVERLDADTDFYRTAGDTLDEARKRVAYLKDVIENKDGYRVFYGLGGKPVRREEVVQLLFRLTWFGSPSDVNREPNNGRGPVDFKVSRGAGDASLVEFKLAKNSKLEANLRHQVEIYKKANDTKKALKVIVAFSSLELKRAKDLVEKLGMRNDPDVILINADASKRVSASKVRR
jgi:hypothetical protein